MLILNADFILRKIFCANYTENRTNDVCTSTIGKEITTCIVQSALCSQVTSQTSNITFYRVYREITAAHDLFHKKSKELSNYFELKFRKLTLQNKYALYIKS